MKKKCIILAAALCVALVACQRQPAQESALPATVIPTAVVTAAQTVKPTATSIPVVTMEPLAAHTAEPVNTPAPTPAPTPRPTPPKVSVPPSVEPTAPIVETPGPELTPPPVESAELPPAPTESLCSLPLAPTPTPEGGQPPAVTDAPTPSESLEPVASPSQTTEPGQTLEPTLSPEPVRPTDEEVLSAYQVAYEAYTWFDLTTLPLDYDKLHTATVGESVLHFFEVTDQRFPNMDALRGYLKGLFSDEVVDRLLPIDGEHYMEIDGVLCAMDGMRGTNENSGAVTKMVLWPEEGGDTLCTVHVEVELLWEDENYPEGKRVYDFPYQKVGDKWVFTSFESIM